jgi:hypothetical protein
VDKFADAPWGTSLADFKKLHPEAKCREFLSHKGVQECDVAGADPKEHKPLVAAFFYDGTMEKGTVEFVGVPWSAVKDILVQRYGNPQSNETEKMENAFGAVYDKETMSWASEKAIARAEEWQERLATLLGSGSSPWIT